MRRMSGRKNVRLLVLDDQPEHFEELKEYAEMYNSAFKVECCLAGTNKDADEIIAKWGPSVVLFDVHSLGVDGTSWVRQISSSGLPVVAMSSRKSRDIEDSMISNGAASYILKSQNPDDLENLLEHIANIASLPCSQH